MQLRSAPKTTAIRVPLEEPHFDEVATVLSARPVVPLQEIQPQTRPTKGLIVGLVVLVALMIGAFGATLIYKLRRVETVASGSELEGSNVQPVSSIEAGVGAEVPTESPRESQTVAENPRVAPGIIKSEQSITPVKKIKTETPPARHEVEIADQRSEDKDLRWLQKREARRQRRAEKQAMRRGGEREGHSDDLFRIREIFEGSPRP